MKFPCFSVSEAAVVGAPDNQQQHATNASGNLEAQYELQITPVEAWQGGRLTLGFSGGGFLLPYHLGVYQSLAAMGLVSPNTPMAGASAGSLVVSGIKSGLSLQEQMDSCLEVAHECREQGVNGRLRRVLKAQLNRTLPADAHVRCSDGTCWISVTQVLPRPANKLYGGFSNRHQLIKALLASCHLPRVSDGSLFTSYKALHKRVFDGGFSNLCPVPPAPPPRSAHSTSTTAADISTTASISSNGQTPAAEAVTSVAAAQPHQVESSSTAAAPQDVHSATGVQAGAQGVAAAGDPPEQPGSVGPLPTAPASALVLQHSDSTKGITTRLLPNKRPGSNTSKHSRSSKTAQAHHSNSLGYNSSNSRSSSSHHHGSTGAGGGSSSLFARGRQARQQLALADSCEVVGAGAYVTAPGWFAVRVCVLPARFMHQFPAMFRAPAADELSIALDTFQAWEPDLNATTQLALYPQDDDFLWQLFHRGQQDAISWAQQQGFPAEVLQQVLSGAAAAVPELNVVRGVMQGEERGQQEQEQRQQQRKSQEQEAATVDAAAEGLAEVTAAMQIAAGGGPAAGASGKS